MANNTQLALQFDQARDALNTAVTCFIDSATALAGAADGHNPETRCLLEDESDQIHRSVRTMMRALCDQTGVDFFDHAAVEALAARPASTQEGPRG